MAWWWRYRFGAHRRSCLWLGLAVLCLVLGAGCGGLCWRRLPPGVYVQGAVQPVSAIRFLNDQTYVDAAGVRQSEQRLFEEIFGLIGAARSYVIADMFLFNAWTGEASAFRPLSAEFTEALVAKRRVCPECTVVLITDPINTAYGGVVSPHLERLRAAGVVVVETDLDRLRDSNAVYSAFWRVLARPFGNAPGGILPNPFDGGRVTLRTYLRLLNFKANHRKLVIADPGGVPTALVTSANPHDGSSAHSNSGVLFSGPAALELLGIELAVAAFSGVSVDLAVPAVSWPAPALPVTVQVVTERCILEAVLGALAAARPGDEVDLVMFYLSHRGIIEALQAAWRRGVRVRVVLDPNKDAFGREKGGMPNRQAARDLHRAGVPVRWYDTHGEQCHTKMLLVRSADGAGELHLGSANYTRRNLENLNLETNVVVRGPAASAVFIDARDSVEAIWNNTGGRHCTVDYEHYRDHAWLKYWRYRFMEASGLSTF
ncbi:MAG: phospholipase [Lentisphaerae bacterium]|nr:phospholipase [Lentisphaerota bacterium]